MSGLRSLVDAVLTQGYQLIPASSLVLDNYVVFDVIQLIQKTRIGS